MLTGWTDFLPEAALSWGDNLEFLLRILLSAALGSIIGLERSKRLKEAGIRTHCIIACAAAVFMILSKYGFSDLYAVAGVENVDAARIAAQVVSGISFLGAGVIFKQGGSVRGLTTAAGIWATAAVGMSVGAGLYWLALAATAVILGLQLLMHRFPVGSDTLSLQEVQVCMDDREALYREFMKLLEAHGSETVKCGIHREAGQLTVKLTVRSEMPLKFEEAADFMHSHEGVYSISL